MPRALVSAGLTLPMRKTQISIRADLTIRLARGDAPISGRIVDLEGRPVAGATIRPEEILEPERDDLSAWIGAATSGPGTRTSSNANT